MGTLHHGGTSFVASIDDVTLAHVKAALVTKLRRAASFLPSWHPAEGQSDVRTTVWAHPSIPLQFVFDDPEPTQLGAQWIDQISRSPEEIHFSFWEPRRTRGASW